VGLKHSTAGILHRLERIKKIRSNLVVFTGLTESHLEGGQAWSVFKVGAGRQSNYNSTHSENAIAAQPTEQNNGNRS
jgi:hypothetical protein